MDQRVQIVKDAVEDLALNLVQYDRREDEELPEGSIEELIEANELSVEQIVSWFNEALRRQLSA